MPLVMLAIVSHIDDMGYVLMCGKYFNDNKGVKWLQYFIILVILIVFVMFNPWLGATSVTIIFMA